MAELPPTQWAMLMPDGSVVFGGGDGPNGNVCGLMREAVAAMFSFLGLPRLVIAGPALVACAADIDLAAGVKQRVWSFGELLGEGRRVFVWSGGQLVGIGRTQEEVGRAVIAIQTAAKARGACA